jgi:hypothetical protein
MAGETSPSRPIDYHSDTNSAPFGMTVCSDRQDRHGHGTWSFRMSSSRHAVMTTLICDRFIPREGPNGILVGYGVIGSTTDSGSVSLGSSPGTPANALALAGPRRRASRQTTPGADANLHTVAASADTPARRSRRASCRTRSIERPPAPLWRPRGAEPTTTISPTGERDDHTEIIDSGRETLSIVVDRHG